MDYHEGLLFGVLLVVAAGAVAGGVLGKGVSEAGESDSVVRKTLCYNPEMEYRRLGKTNLRVSAVCLGGTGSALML